MHLLINKYTYINIHVHIYVCIIYKSVNKLTVEVAKNANGLQSCVD